MIVIQERINRYKEVVRDVVSDGTKIGELRQDRNSKMWRAYDWAGGAIWTKDSAGWRGAFETTLPFAAVKCIADYYNSNKDRFETWLAEKKEKERANEYLSTTKVVKMLADGNDSFYPTPEVLAGKMCGKIRTDWRKINSVLEPSAGKGNLVDALNRFLQSKYAKDRWSREESHFDKVDVLEIDVNLQCLLKGKGLRVIGDDFLQFRSAKAYDLILMNPDFSNGDAHLLKAIEIQERFGGEIVCLLNAETIRNPYSNRRKLLRQKLAEYNAHIDFVEHAFMRAERKTDVEVAIVEMLIPSQFKSHNILEGFEKAKDRVVEEKEQLGIRLAGDYVYDLITDYNLEAEVGYKIISEFAAISPILNSGEDYRKLLKIEICEKDVTAAAPSTAYNNFLAGLRMRYWKRLFERDEIRQKMTSRMSNEYTSKLSEMRDYEFNEYNIRTFVLELQGQLLEGVENSIMHLFDELSSEHAYYPECQTTIHYYNGWKSNKAHAVNFPKVIIPMNGFETHYNWEKDWQLDEYNIVHTISDLERAMRYLEKGEIDFYVRPENSVRMAKARGDFKNIEFTYFYVTFYKKGTAHIKWKAEAKPLIDRLNIFAAQKRCWLPPNYGKVRYEDMTDEEKAVIDEFQTRAEYEKVMSEPKNYLLSSDSVGIKMLSA